jgi:hypothetical protein
MEALELPSNGAARGQNGLLFGQFGPKNALKRRRTKSLVGGINNPYFWRGEVQ